MFFPPSLSAADEVAEVACDASLAGRPQPTDNIAKSEMHPPSKLHNGMEALSENGCFDELQGHSVPRCRRCCINPAVHSSLIKLS